MSAVGPHCINCGLRLTRIQRHVLSNEDESLVNIIMRWTSPRDRTETDCVCHACWEAADGQLRIEREQQQSSRQFGHHHLCVNCGRSILRARRLQVLRPNANEQQQMIAAVISAWIQPRQLTSADQACFACWLRARRATQRSTNESAQLQSAGDSASFDYPTDQPIEMPESNLNDAVQNESAQLQSAGDSASSDYPTDQPIEMPESNLNDAVQITCINCDMQISHESAHPISSMSQNLLTIVSLWTYTNNVNPTDHLCNSCWELAMFQLQHNCIVCGTSTVETESYFIDGSLEGGILIAEIINQRIHPRQVTSLEPICETCWTQAQEEILRRQERQFRAQSVTLPNIKRVSESARYCLFRGCQNTERLHVPDNIRRQVLKNFNVFIPRESRVCTYHLGRNAYEELYTAEYALDSFHPTQIEDMVFILTEESNSFEFDDVQSLPDHWVHFYIGITKQQHNQILQNTERLRSTRRGSLALTALLAKLRTGESNERLSQLFKLPRQTFEFLMKVAREILVMDYVPLHLGMEHTSREDVIRRNSTIAEGLFGNPDAPLNERNAIVIADGTYIFTQKSSNYLFQKNTYSLHKYRNLVKPFLVVSCDGYILDIFGPYAATTNDATILSDLLDKDYFINFFNNDDVFILDRGFRDCMDKIHDKGLLSFMPETLSPGQSQLTTLEGNRSRCVTINRWVVEAVNGQIKRDFKLFRQEFFNRACTHLMKDLKIACAILNAFGTRFTNPTNADLILNIINERLFMDNQLAEIVSTERLHRRNVMFTNIDVANIYFPRLSLEQLVLFACGTYQIRQARSYIGEHFRFHGIYNLEISRDQLDLSSLGGNNNFLIRAKLKSRHVSRRTYFVFVAIDRDRQDQTAIIGYCCNCIVGLRTVGCCSHVMSVVWYLAYARHEGTTPPAEFLDQVLLFLDE